MSQVGANKYLLLLSLYIPLDIVFMCKIYTYIQPYKHILSAFFLQIVFCTLLFSHHDLKILKNKFINTFSL